MDFYKVLSIFITLPNPAHPLDEGWEVWGMVESDGILDLLQLLPFLSHRAENYLYNRRTWSICLEPEGIVTWHVGLFSLLLLLSLAEMVLALLQILNGCLGCLCGFCEGK